MSVRVLIDWEYDVGRYVVHRRQSFLDQCYYGADEVEIPLELWERYVRLERERREVTRLLGEHRERSSLRRTSEQLQREEAALASATYANVFGEVDQSVATTQEFKL